MNGCDLAHTIAVTSRVGVVVTTTVVVDDCTPTRNWPHAELIRLRFLSHWFIMFTVGSVLRLPMVTVLKGPSVIVHGLQANF